MWEFSCQWSCQFWTCPHPIYLNSLKSEKNIKKSLFTNHWYWDCSSYFWIAWNRLDISWDCGVYQAELRVFYFSWLTVASSASCSSVGSTPYCGSVAPQKLLVWPSGFLTPDILERGAGGAAPGPSTALQARPAANSSSSRRVLMSTSCCLSRRKYSHDSLHISLQIWSVLCKHYNNITFRLSEAYDYDFLIYTESVRWRLVMSLSSSAESDQTIHCQT